MTEHLWWYRARLRRLIDADTVELVLDCGFHGHHIERVRVAGCDAPESRTDAGLAARLWALEWFEQAEAATVSEWTLLVHTQQVDSRHGVAQDMSLGRYLADVFDAETGDSLAEDLIAAGHATRRGA